MAGVFISYRRSDSQAWADRLADSLILRFGGGLIWRDVDDIPAGEPWPTEIRKALAAADAVLVLIGPDWLDNPRLTQRRDVLRHEIQTALQSKASVVPLLVGGAAIPEPNKLPRAIRSLATLAKRQGLTLRDGWYWRDDVNVLLRAPPDRREQAAQRAPEATLREAGTVSGRLFLSVREARAGAGRRTANVGTAR